ncbi:MAG: glutathione S-transferase family protein, partial [Planctomycetota bacterium]
MSEPIRLYEIPPSPNNIKVRVAMNYKGIPFERIPLSRDASGKDLDRTAVIAATGQPLTPAIEHEGRALFDSAAILCYLEANFPGTPPLFSTDVDTLRAIEGEERWARTVLSGPFTKTIRMFFAGQADADAVEQANREFQRLTGRIETILEKSPWLAGNS